MKRISNGRLNSSLALTAYTPVPWPSLPLPSSLPYQAHVQEPMIVERINLGFSVGSAFSDMLIFFSKIPILNQASSPSEGLDPFLTSGCVLLCSQLSFGLRS
jgi:hypothetical protein